MLWKDELTVFTAIMRLLIVLSAYLVLAYGRNQQQQQRATSEFSDPRDCQDSSNRWECLCRQLGYDINGCEGRIRGDLSANTGVKICEDEPNIYLATNKCHYEGVIENAENPTGKAMQFALDLFKAADPKNPNKNYIISPLSPQVLLAQLLDGCSEPARIELAKAVRLNSREVSSLTKALQDSANKQNSFNKLDIASVIFRSANLNLTEKFTSGRKANNIKMSTTDFSDTTRAVQEINQWVTHQTRGNIQEIVSESNLSPETSMLLLNAIYFKGTWRYMFNESATDKRSKFNIDGKQFPVHMMSQTNRLRFGEINFGQYWDPDNGMRWVELPYEGDQLSMILLLPKTRYQLDQTLEQVTGLHLQEIFKTIKRDYNPTKIHLKVPKFTIRDSVSLVEPLKKLGAKRIFEDERALSELSNTPVKVGDVKQESFLSVDEKGTTATAVTKITIIPLSLNAYEDITFTCDEPFMVMIVDKPSQIPLFMAKIKQPIKAKPT